MSRFVLLIAVAMVCFLVVSTACGGPLYATMSASGAAGPGGPGAPTGTSTDDPAPGPQTAPAREAIAPAGCARGLTLAAPPSANLVRQVVSGGRERAYRVHIPSQMASGEAVPIVLNFHGRGSTAADQEALSGLVPISDREGFLLVSPEGTGSPRGWSAGASLPDWPTDDQAFVSDLLLTLQRDFCVNASRVYATGFSNGAFMASRLACVMGDRVAAVAAVAGAYFPDDACGRPVPLLAIHGTSDSVVPFGPGRVRDTFVYRGVRAEVDAWAGCNRCRGVVTHGRDVDGNVTDSYSECDAETALIEVADADHAWPAASAESIWAFFTDKRLSSP